MRKSRQAKLFYLSIFMMGLVLFSPGVYAYLDPSTGSMVVSAIVGIIASIALAMKTYWYKIKGFFKRGQEDTKSKSESD